MTTRLRFACSLAVAVTVALGSFIGCSDDETQQDAPCSKDSDCPSPKWCDKGKCADCWSSGNACGPSGRPVGACCSKSCGKTGTCE